MFYFRKATTLFKRQIQALVLGAAFLFILLSFVPYSFSNRVWQTNLLDELMELQINQEIEIVEKGKEAMKHQQTCFISNSKAVKKA